MPNGAPASAPKFHRRVQQTRYSVGVNRPILVIALLLPPALTAANVRPRVMRERSPHSTNGRAVTAQRRSETRHKQRWDRAQLFGRGKPATPAPRARQNGNNGKVHAPSPAPATVALPEALTPDEYGALLSRWRDAGVVVIRGEMAKKLVEWRKVFAFGTPAYEASGSRAYVLPVAIAEKAAQREYETLEGMRKMRFQLANSVFSAAAAEALQTRVNIGKARAPHVIVIVGGPPPRSALPALEARLQAS